MSGYALQLLAVIRVAPEQREAVVAALWPIDEFRAAAGRRAVANDDEEDEPDDPPIVAAPPEPQPTGSD